MYNLKINGLIIKTVETYEEGYNLAMELEEERETFKKSNVVDARSIFGRLGADAEITIEPK